MAKQIIYNDDARHALARGVNALANVVKVTLGPNTNGRTNYPRGIHIL